MKTAISIPDVVFEEAERLARRLDESRSQLYTEAVVEYLARHDPDTITKRLDEVCESIGASDVEDRFATATVLRIFERVEW